MTPQSHEFILDLLIREWEEALMEMQRHDHQGDEAWSRMVQRAARVHFAITEFRKMVKQKEVTQ